MATKKLVYGAGGKVQEVTENAPDPDASLVRAISLNDARKNAYSTTVGVDGFTVFIFEHKRAAVKEFRRRLEELSRSGVELQARPYPAPPVLTEGATKAQEKVYEKKTKAWRELMDAELETRTAESQALETAMETIFAEFNACVRGWDFPDENGEQKRRAVDYGAEVEAENIGPSMIPLLFQRLWEKHTLGSDERQQLKRF